MKNFNLEEVLEKYKDNRDVISLFSGAMGLDIGLGKAFKRGRRRKQGRDGRPYLRIRLYCRHHHPVKRKGADKRKYRQQNIGDKINNPFLFLVHHGSSYSRDSLIFIRCR